MRKVTTSCIVLTLLALIAAGLAVVPAVAVAQETVESKTFVVVGTAAVQGEDVSDARENAIADGLDTAVALMTAELLEVESFVEHFSNLSGLLFDQANAYVSSYKVLTETAREKTYHVIVETSVSRSKISQYLTEAGILKVKTALPSVLLLIAEQNLSDLYPGFWWGVEGADFESVSQSVMVDRLKEAGFHVIDHTQARSGELINWAAFDKPDLLDQEAAELGALLKADVVIIGESSVAPSTNIMGSAMRSFNGTVAARVIRTESAEPVIDLARTAVAVSEDDASGTQTALEDIGDLAGQAISEALTTAWQEQAAKPSEILMVIRGTGHLASYVKFRKAMNTISGVEGIKVRGIKPNEATLLVEYKGKTKDLAAALLQQNFVSFGINIFEVTEDMIRVELIPQ